MVSDWWQTPENDPAFHRLRDEVASGEAIAFVGAGASAGLYPLWQDLITQLANEAVDNGVASESERILWLKESKPLDALEGIKRALNRGGYVQAIRRIFEPHKGADGNYFTAVQGLLVRFGFRGFVTTNYDDGLVCALEQLQQRPNIATWKDNGSVYRWLDDKIFKEAGRPILFAHGRYSQEDTIVLGAEDYRQAYNSEGLYRQLFNKLWGQSRLVFVGFGFSDPWLEFLADQEITRTEARNVASPRHIAIIGLAPSKSDSRERHKQFRDKYNADLLVYPVRATNGSSEDHSTLVSMLKMLANASDTISQRLPLLANPVSIQRDPNTINIRRLPSPRMDSIGRDKELTDLSDSWNNGAINILSLIAAGGAGKTALVRKWLNEMERQNYDGARRILGWSFESGRFNDPAASADEFIAEALEFFGDSTFDQDSPWANGERLADHIRQERNLLILDGLETLQSDREVECGAIKDPALATLITELARENPGLCIITSRVAVTDIGSSDHAILKDLEQLSPQAGRNILEKETVLGSVPQLEQTSVDFGRHALALTLLATYLKRKYHRHGDRYVYHAKDVPNCDETVPKEKRHPYRVMRGWAQMLRGTADLELLYLIGLFNKPVELQTIQLFNDRHCPFNDRHCPALPGLTGHLRNLDDASWLRLIWKLDNEDHLISFRGISGSGDSGAREWIDAHPLVREFFGREFRTTHLETWRAAHRWLYDCFCKITRKKPDSVPELEPLYEAVAHGCQAGIYDVALRDVFIERIRRGREEAYSALMLGAHGADLSAISGFFKYGSQTVAAYDEPIDVLEDDDKAFVRGVASFSLRALGRLKEACETRYVALDTSLRRHDWHGASYDAPALAEILLILGDIRAARIIARLGVEVADNCGHDELRRVDNRATLADVLHQAGKFDEAEQLFAEAEAIIRERTYAMAPQLFLLPGVQYCELLLSKCRLSAHGQECPENLQRIIERAKMARELAKNTKDAVLGTALAQLSLGQAYLEAYSKSGDFRHLEEAEGPLDEAVNGLRKARQQDLIPLGLLARAALRREKGKHRGRPTFREARQDLNSAMAIATSGSAKNPSFGRMKLHEADIHLGYARLSLSEAEIMYVGAPKVSEKISDARESMKNAAKIVRETGYHRRDVDLKELSAWQ